jgi:Zn-dependent protease with chaperone function
MTTWSLGAFNLLINAAVAFAFAMGLVALGARVLRLRDGRLRAALLLLPLVKALYEVARGIPRGAFFWAKLGGATQEVGSFRLGFGVTRPLVPVIDLSLGASFHGRSYAQSIADVLASGLAKKVSPWAPAVLGAALVTVALCRTAHWLVTTLAGARARARLVRAARVIDVRPLGGLHERARVRARIVVSDDTSAGGVPFAGGLLRPWICFPAAAYEALSVDEREAVIAHEMAHLRHLDGVLLVVASAAAAALGFIPGVARLVGAIRAQCELAADAAASRVVSPAVLASAIVSVTESMRVRGAARSGDLALIRPGRLLGKRVAALLDDEARPSRSWSCRLLSLGGVALLAAAILRATTLGNP